MSRSKSARQRRPIPNTGFGAIAGNPRGAGGYWIEMQLGDHTVRRGRCGFTARSGGTARVTYHARAVHIPLV